MRHIKTLIITASFALIYLVPALPVHAVDVFDDICKNGNAQDSTVCKSKDIGSNNPLFGPSGVLTTAINIMSAIVGVVAVIMLIIGGFKMVTSGNNPQEVTKARETIVYAVIGLIIAGLAQTIVQFFLKKIS